MTRTYELGIVIEPRQSDDDVKALVDRYTSLVTDSGAEIKYVDDWGKRKLAYPIRKYNEGRYVFVYVSATDTVPWPDVERLMMQDENVLRHLVVRTDQDLKRSKRGKIVPVMPWEKEAAKAEAAEGGN